MKTLEYPLLALALDEDDCTHLMAPILSGGSQSIGVSRSMGRSLIYARLKYQGLDLHKLYTTKGLIYVKGLINHIWQGRTMVKLMKTSLEYEKMWV